MIQYSFWKTPQTRKQYASNMIVSMLQSGRLFTDLPFIPKINIFRLLCLKNLIILCSWGKSQGYQVGSHFCKYINKSQCGFYIFKWLQTVNSLLWFWSWVIDLTDRLHGRSFKDVKLLQYSWFSFKRTTFKNGKSNVAKLSSSWQVNLNLSWVSSIITVPVSSARPDPTRPPGKVSNKLFTAKLTL